MLLGVDIGSGVGAGLVVAVAKCEISSIVIIEMINIAVGRNPVKTDAIIFFWAIFSPAAG